MTELTEANAIAACKVMSIFCEFKLDILIFAN